MVWRSHYQVSNDVIDMERNEVNRSAHSTWRCQLPRRIHTEIPQEGDIRTIKGRYQEKLCEEKKVEIIEVEACVDHIWTMDAKGNC